MRPAPTTSGHGEPGSRRGYRPHPAGAARRSRARPRPPGTGCRSGPRPEPPRRSQSPVARCGPPQCTVTRSLRLANVFSPTSFLVRRSSTTANGCCSREAMILVAVTGPIPGSASSSPAVARFRSTGAVPPAFEAAPGPGLRRASHRIVARRDPYLVAVVQWCGEVQVATGSIRVDARAVSARRFDQVADARAWRQAVDTRLLDGTDDLHDQEAILTGGIEWDRRSTRPRGRSRTRRPAAPWRRRRPCRRCCCRTPGRMRRPPAARHHRRRGRPIEECGRWGTARSPTAAGSGESSSVRHGVEAGSTRPPGWSGGRRRESRDVSPRRGHFRRGETSAPTVAPRD